MAPEAVAGAMRIVTRLLPPPGTGPEAAALRRSRDLDLGWVARFMPTDGRWP
jgi:hypothetical protein